MRLILLLALAGPLVTHAQSLERWNLPDPDEMIKASNTLCVEQSRSALLAWEYKKQGRGREELLALIPDSPKAFELRLTSAMRENIEDAFAFPELSQYTYYSFRSEVCMRETLGAIRMPRLAAVHAQVAECQQLHGRERSAMLFKCVQSAVRAVSPR